MKFTTTRFGELQVPDETLILLDEGILGFPDDHRFVILDHDTGDTPFKWLQAIDNPGLAFVVMDPTEIAPDYRFTMDADEAEKIGSPATDDQIAMVIVNIPHNNPIAMTANLRAPIVVNAQNRQGIQIIHTDETYPFDHRIFADPQPEAAETGAPEAAGDADAPRPRPKPRPMS